MKRCIIVLLFIASALHAQEYKVLALSRAMPPRYYFGMTVKEAEDVSLRGFPPTFIGMNSDKMYLDSATGKRSGTITIDSEGAPYLFPKKKMKLQLSFLRDTLRSLEVTLFDAKRCDSPQDAACLRDTTGDYKLIYFMLGQIDTARSVAMASPGETNIFHITRMNRFAKIETCDKDGRWHDFMRVDKRFFARILTKRDNDKKFKLEEILIDDNVDERGGITCSCGEGIPTDDHAAIEK